MPRHTLSRRRPKPVKLPPLRDGERLSRAEFDRRYDAMPDLKKAERIEGVVVLALPTTFRRHGKPHSHLTAWMVAYEAATPGVETGQSATVRIDSDNDPQPDVFLRIDLPSTGRSRVSVDDYVEGAPELIAEVSASTARLDLGPKLNVYRRNGVKEYLVWRVARREILWLELRDGRYEPLERDADGILQSRVFPGLWLDPRALVEGQIARVLEALQEGIRSAAHARFVAALKRAR